MTIEHNCDCFMVFSWNDIGGYSNEVIRFEYVFSSFLTSWYKVKEAHTQINLSTAI